MWTKRVESYIKKNKIQYDLIQNYEIIRNIHSTLPAKENKNNDTQVTIATQCSINNVGKVIKLKKYWKGPVSVSVFINYMQLNLFLNVLFKIYLCFPNFFSSQFLIHVVILSYDGYLNNIINNGEIKRIKKVLLKRSCMEFIQDLETLTPNNYRNSLYLYPVNILRNVAMETVKTNFVFPIDVDMIISGGMFENLNEFLKKQIKFQTSLPLPPFSIDSHFLQFVYVVPSFETPNFSFIPENKKELKKYYDEKIIIPFYSSLCQKCHQPTNYNKWFQYNIKNINNSYKNDNHITDENSKNITIIYESKWRPSYEPFFIIKSGFIFFPPVFHQYGFNRLALSCHLHLLGVRFMVLDNVFLLHVGLKHHHQFHQSKLNDQVFNRELYLEFLDFLDEEGLIRKNRDCF